MFDPTTYTTAKAENRVVSVTLEIDSKGAQDKIIVTTKNPLSVDIFSKLKLQRQIQKILHAHQLALNNLSMLSISTGPELPANVASSVATATTKVNSLAAALESLQSIINDAIAPGGTA